MVGVYSGNAGTVRHELAVPDKIHRAMGRRVFGDGVRVNRVFVRIADHAASLYLDILLVHLCLRHGVLSLGQRIPYKLLGKRNNYGAVK